MDALNSSEGSARCHKAHQLWSSLRLWGICFILLLGCIVNFIPGLNNVTLAALGGIRDCGPVGPLVFIALFVVSTLALVPGGVLTLGAGACFGFWLGVTIAIIGSNLGAALAFALGRTLMRSRVQELAKNTRLGKLDSVAGRKGFLLVLLMRLSPMFPFNHLNYCLGATQISPKDYLIGSALGMFPGTLIFVYYGTCASNSFDLTASDQMTPKGHSLVLGCIVFTLAVSIGLYRLLQDSLSKSSHIELSDDEITFHSIGHS